MRELGRLSCPERESGGEKIRKAESLEEGEVCMFLPPLQDICMKPVREKVPTFMTIEGADSTSGITSSDLVTQIDK